MNSLKYVIIGNSAAAVGAVEAIRKNDTGGRIVIISNETIIHIQDLDFLSFNGQDR